MRSRRAVFWIRCRMALSLALLCAGAACNRGGRDATRETENAPPGHEDVPAAGARIEVDSGDQAAAAPAETAAAVAGPRQPEQADRDSAALAISPAPSVGSRLAAILAGLALFAVLGVVAVLWRLTREVMRVSEAVREAATRLRIPERSSGRESTFDWGAGLDRLERGFQAEAEQTQEVARQLQLLNGTIVSAGTALAAPLRESAVRVQLPGSSIVGESTPPSAVADPSSDVVRVIEGRIQKVFDTLHENQERVGGEGELQREAERLKELTGTIARAAALLDSRLETLTGDDRAQKLAKELSKLRARCEQLAGRYSELQMSAGVTAFPLRAYVYPNHADVRSVADQVVAGLEESASLLAGRTELLRKQFGRMVSETLRPTLEAANYLRADDGEPDWLRAICKVLRAVPTAPHAGQGADPEYHEVLSGPPVAPINRVRAIGYKYDGQVLIRALVETDGHH